MTFTATVVLYYLGDRVLVGVGCMVDGGGFCREGEICRLGGFVLWFEEELFVQDFVALCTCHIRVQTLVHVEVQLSVALHPKSNPLWKLHTELVRKVRGDDGLGGEGVLGDVELTLSAVAKIFKIKTPLKLPLDYS